MSGSECECVGVMFFSVCLHYRSLLGGQLLDIEGQGFGTDSSQIEVLLGDKPCKLEELSDSLIRCITPSTVTTHTIDNNA